MAFQKLDFFLLVLGVAGSVVGTFSVANNSSIVFQLSAKNLPSFDPFGGYPDPYVIITYENPPNPPLKLGETSKLADTQNPNWPESFNVIYLNGSSQTLKLELYDEDVDADDYMGAVTIRVDEIISTFGGILERNITADDSNTVNGQLFITANITNARQ